MNNIEDELGSDIFAGIEVEEAPAARSAITDFEEVRTLWDSAVEQKYLRMMSDPTFDMTKANTRFSTSLPLNRVYNATAAIVGAGGLDNWQWRTLLCMGFRHVAIFDDDTVGIENVGPQAHSMLDIGMPKVEAVRRAALEYRGVAITAVNERVYTYADICEKLGYQPDIVITCTDSAEFRNGFIRDMQGCMSYLSRIDDVPELLLDYRMSLGDWVCYAIPSRAWKIFAAREHTSRRLMNKYLNEAVFSAEEALHEPCTERAIAYTGMHAASYTGAYLHWWLGEGRDLLPSSSWGVELPLINDKYAMDAYVDGDLKFSWKQTYSARDWESLTTTRAEAIWRKKYAAVSEELDNYEEQLTSTVRWITGREQLESSFVLLDREDLIKAMNGGAYIVAHDITYATPVLGIDTRNQIPLRKGAFIRLTSLCAKHDREEGRIVIKVMDNDRNTAAEWPVFISEDESGKKRLFTCSGVLLYGSWAFTPNDVEGIDRFVVSSHGNTLINEGKFGVIGIDENNEEKSVIVDNFAFLESLLDWKEISAIVRSDEVKDGNNTRAEYVITIDKLRVEDIEEDTVIYVPSLGKETHCFRVCSIGQDRMYLCEYSSAWTLRDEFIIHKKMLGDEEMYLCVRSES